MRHHDFFRSLKKTHWEEYQIGPILVSSILINLLELASPIYVNLVYTNILPTGSISSLTVLTIGVVVLIALAGWLRAVRMELTGFDGARVEHRRRMEALAHFTQLRLSDYLRDTPATHAERLNTINLLRDESASQAFTTAIDLIFSVFFIFVLFLIGGSLGLIALAAILVYILRSLQMARSFEAISKQTDRLELDRVNYQSQLMGAIDLIKSNGLGRSFMIGNEDRQERLAWQRMKSQMFSGQQMAFGMLMNQITMACLVTWGAFLVISGQLVVGALAAALLLGGKVLQPWQQALGLWSSYRRLIHSRDELNALMSLPEEPEGGNAELNTEQEDIQLSIDGQASAPIQRGKTILVRDSTLGTDARRLFMGLIQIDSSLRLEVDGVPIESFKRERLRSDIIYVDPSHDFFEGTLLQNITAFQPTRYSRRALFWSYLVGTDQKVRRLSEGYSTRMGTSNNTGLSRDSLLLFQVISGLVKDPILLLLDLSDCSYGKEFIDGLERLLKRARGRTTILMCGSGNALRNLVDSELDLNVLPREVFA